MQIQTGEFRKVQAHDPGNFAKRLLSVGEVLHVALEAATQFIGHFLLGEAMELRILAHFSLEQPVECLVCNFGVGVLFHLGRAVFLCISAEFR